jgi:hypothetical protein
VLNAAKDKLFNEKGRIELKNGFNLMDNAVPIVPSLTNSGGGRDGSADATAIVEFLDADFDDDGELLGDGALRFSGDSSYVTRARLDTSPSLDHRNIDVTFDAAAGGIDSLTGGGGGNAAVTMEATSLYQGQDPAGLETPFAWESLCLINGSVLRLTDDILNQSISSGPTGEAIYVREFGMDASSTIDLAGKRIFYERLIKGGVAGTIIPGLDGAGNPGAILPVPEPAAGLATLLAAPVFAGRRRRKC